MNGIKGQFSDILNFEYLQDQSTFPQCRKEIEKTRIPFSQKRTICITHRLHI